MRAALLLPGIAGSTQTSAAENGTLNLQVSRYEEDARQLPGIDSGLEPLRADTLHLSGALLLRDSIRLGFGITQDTWSGATPVTVAPLAFNGNRPVRRNSGTGTVIAGASPIVNGRVQLDAARKPVADPRNVLVMASASPELRQQADLSLEAPLQMLPRDATFTLATSVSDEPDFRSRYARAGGRFAFNDNLTTLDFGAAYARNDTKALLDSDLTPYVTRSAYLDQLNAVIGGQVLRGERRDRGYDIGFTQIVDAASVFDAGVSLTRSSGFMENPYKAATVIFTGGVPGNVNGDVRAFLEQRPDERRQLAWHAHYARYFGAADGTLQLDYNQSRDDWGVDTHSVEFGWAQALGPSWTLTPRIRYYTQTAADFHTDWVVSEQSYRNIRRDSRGREIWADLSINTFYYRDASGAFTTENGNPVNPFPFDPQPIFDSYSPNLLPAHFSSDHRLGAFDAVSAGLTVQRRFERGVTLEAGFEYYTRTGSGYADFDFALANVALTVDLGASTQRERREQAAMAGHAHTTHAAHTAPAGLAFTHTGLARGSFMSGYRVDHMRQYGDLMQESDDANAATVAAVACRPAARCAHVPAVMTMTMHMLDLTYAVSDRTSLMLMPQYMTTSMKQSPVIANAPPVFGPHSHMTGTAHVSGAIGDTLVAALFNLRSTTTQALRASVAASIPTGKTDLAYRRTFQADGGLMEYDMQTGSGTWDLLPALTWTVTQGVWQHGAQLSGIKRLEERNDNGYRRGDEIQLSGWTVRALSDSVAASLRATWLQRGEIHGRSNTYNAGLGPMDNAANYGGRFVDLGIGVNVGIASSQLALEWLAPVHQDVNGFQLERQGTLSASWHYNY